MYFVYFYLVSERIQSMVYQMLRMDSRPMLKVNWLLGSQPMLKVNWPLGRPPMLMVILELDSPQIQLTERLLDKRNQLFPLLDIPPIRHRIREMMEVLNQMQVKNQMEVILQNLVVVQVVLRILVQMAVQLQNHRQMMSLDQRSHSIRLVIDPFSSNHKCMHCFQINRALNCNQIDSTKHTQEPLD